MTHASDNPIMAHARWKDTLSSELARLKEPHANLTERERQILRLLEQGRSAEDIAKIFHLEKTELLSQLARLQPL